MRWLKHVLRAVYNWIDRKFPDQVILTPATFEHFKHTIEHAVALNQSIGSAVGEYANKLEQQKQRVLDLNENVRNALDILNSSQLDRDNRDTRIEALETELKKLKDEFSAFAISQGFVVGRKPFER